MSRSLGALILLAIFAVFGGAVYWFEIKPSQELAAATPTPSPRDVFTLSGQQFNRLAIAGGSKRFVAEKAGADWQILEPTPGPGDNTAINSIFYSLDTLRAFRQVSENDSELDKYGLAQPALTVDFRTEAGQNYGVLFGTENVDKSYRFAKRADSPAIYLIGSDTYKRLEGLLNTPPYQPTPTPAPPGSPAAAGSPAAPPPAPAGAAPSPGTS